MLFDKNSALVKFWVSMVGTGSYTEDQVPELSNLKDVVIDVLNGVV